jgi:hypothetical protein
MRDSAMLGFAKEFAVPQTEKDPFRESNRRLQAVNDAPFEIRMNQRFNDILKSGNLTPERFDEAGAAAKIEESLERYGKYSFTRGAPPQTAKEMASLTKTEREYWTLKEALENPLVSKDQIASRINRDTLMFDAPMKSYDQHIEEGRKASGEARAVSDQTMQEQSFKNSQSDDDSDTRSAGLYSHPAGWEYKGQDGEVSIYDRKSWELGTDGKLYPYIKKDGESVDTPDFPVGVSRAGGSTASAAPKQYTPEQIKNMTREEKIAALLNRR